MRKNPFTFLAVAFLLLSGSTQAQDPLNWDFSEYREQPGLNAEKKGQVLQVYWEGDGGMPVELWFGVRDGTPVIVRLAAAMPDGDWRVLANDIRPEFRVTSGIRRVTQQQTEPLEEMGIPLTEEILNEIKWDAFWDAPLYISDEPPLSHASSIPAEEPFANHPGMPRKAEEVTRALATYRCDSCVVRTNGNRLEVLFPGVEAGIFRGYLQFDIYRGTHMIRQMLVAKTHHPSAAFKYDAGWSGIPAGNSSGIAWMDLSGRWQNYRLGGPVSDVPTRIKARHRMVVAGLDNGAVAAFPPPHSYYWARETEEVLVNGWYRRDNPDEFSFGICQAEHEENPEFYHNFALYSARPGTWQRMPLFLYIYTGGHLEAAEGALAFTRNDRFKSLEGYKVMGHHYHAGMVKRLKAAGGFHHRLNDVGTMKNAGIDIFSIIDGVRGPARHDRGMAFAEELDEYYRAAASQSDRDILVLANDENSTGGRPPFLGGHYDLLFPGPVHWIPGRAPDQELWSPHPWYGRVYHLGTPEDLMAMCETENVLVSLPHPDTKRSTGYPEAIWDQSHFLHPHYFSLGYRWGMGIDASEIRLGQYRFIDLWDETNNRMAQHDLPPKYALAISEVRSDKGSRGRPPYDDAYGMSPVNYLKLDSLPSPDDYSRVNRVLKNGDYFVTSGEVLIPRCEITTSGDEGMLEAEVEWTFPLEFVELVWGDGMQTGRKIIPAADLPPFGKKTFRIPFQCGDKKWIRFAAWDVATNGAMAQPVDLTD